MKKQIMANKKNERNNNECKDNDELTGEIE